MTTLKQTTTYVALLERAEACKDRKEAIRLIRLAGELRNKNETINS